MDVMQTGSTTAFGASAAPADAVKRVGDATEISSDFETFLKMLTAQMENQDPLNPMESTDYATQLATFSGVEQQVLTNDLIKSLQTQLGVMSMTDLAGWVGMEARAAVPVQFGLEPITVTPDPADGATSTYMVVRNANDVEVDRVEIPPTEAPVRWAGMDPYGNLFPPGEYAFHLQSFANGELLSETPMAVYSEVVEAKVVDGETMLVFASGDEIAASDVSSLRAPRE